MSYEPRDYGDEYGQQEYGYDDYAPEAVARARTNVPGIFIFVLGILNIPWGLYCLVDGAFVLMNPDLAVQMQKQWNLQGAQQGTQPEQIMQAAAVGYLVLGVLVLIASLVMIVGGLKMRALQAYGLAMTASILAMLPCISVGGCCLFGEALGIWAIVVLLNEDVKSAFR
jgi:hypothetical protein